MLGIGKRKKYNGAIDTKLNNEYQIQTKGNLLFPNVGAYLDLIDNAWKTNMSVDDGVLYIATLYYCGLVRQEHNEEAKDLLQRINSIVEFGLPKGIISEEKWSKFSKAIADATS
jgi:hypothetical protein